MTRAEFAAEIQRIAPDLDVLHERHWIWRASARVRSRYRRTWRSKARDYMSLPPQLRHLRNRPWQTAA